MFELPLDFGQFALVGGDTITERAHLGAPPLALFGRRLAQLARLARALRAQFIQLVLKAAPAGVGLEDRVDFGGIDAALGQLRFDEIRLFANESNIKHSKGVPQEFEMATRAVFQDRDYVKAYRAAVRAMALAHISRPRVSDGAACTSSPLPGAHR